MNIDVDGREEIGVSCDRSKLCGGGCAIIVTRWRDKGELDGDLRMAGEHSR